MLNVEIKKGETKSELLRLGHKQLATVFLPPTLKSITFTVMVGHDQDNVGILYKNGQPLTITSDKEYSVHLFSPSDFEGAQVLVFKSDTPLDSDYKLWLYLHTF